MRARRLQFPQLLSIKLKLKYDHSRTDLVLPEPWLRLKNGIQHFRVFRGSFLGCRTIHETPETHEITRSGHSVINAFGKLQAH